MIQGCKDYVVDPSAEKQAPALDLPMPCLMPSLHSTLEPDFFPECQVPVLLCGDGCSKLERVSLPETRLLNCCPFEQACVGFTAALMLGKGCVCGYGRIS